MRTVTPTYGEIIRAWYYFEGTRNNPSTEWLFARVIDYYHHNIDSGDIAYALQHLAGMNMVQIEQEYKLNEFVP